MSKRKTVKLLSDNGIRYVRRLRASFRNMEELAVYTQLSGPTLFRMIKQDLGISQDLAELLSIACCRWVQSNDFFSKLSVDSLIVNLLPYAPCFVLGTSPEEALGFVELIIGMLREKRDFNEKYLISKKVKGLEVMQVCKNVFNTLLRVKDER